MVARRDIKAGEVILREHPIVLGPKITSYVMCLGCHKTIPPTTAGDYYKCSTCTWPVCGQSCEKLPAHVDECQLMSSRNFKSSIRSCGSPKIEASYCVITPLRVILLKKSNPKAFETVMSLHSHLDQRISTVLYRHLRTNLIPFIRNFLGMIELTDNDILSIAGILDTNCFDVVLPSKQIKIRGIFPMSAMMASECVPNTKHFVDENFEMRVIASVPIKKGEMILTSYTHPLKTTMERRHQLKEAKCFDCICARCVDPTEMNTFASCVRCQSCAEGICIPVDLISWRCTLCEAKLGSNEATAILSAARMALDSLNKKSIDDCEGFLKKFERILPSSSVFIVDVKYALSLLYGNVAGYRFEGLCIFLNTARQGRS